MITTRFLKQNLAAFLAAFLAFSPAAPALAANVQKPVTVVAPLGATHAAPVPAAGVAPVTLTPAIPQTAAPAAAAQGPRAIEQVQGPISSGDVEKAGPALGATYDGGKPAAENAAVAGADAVHESGLAPSALSQNVFHPKTIDAPLPDDPMGVTVHRLANGLTVYLSPNPLEPRVAFGVAVRSGARHDPLDATGMAHYLEHMQFKGSQNLGTTDYAKEKVHLDRITQLYDDLFVAKDPAARAAIYDKIDKESQEAAKYAVPNEFDKIYARHGFDEVNAYTSQERTVYIGRFPSNKAEVWARVETDRVTDPVYRLFLPELEAVYEEYNRAQDNPGAAFHSARNAAVFGAHPYGRDVIGLREHLKNPSLSSMKRFFDAFYKPNNMALVLSGDFKRAEMLALIEKRFGALKPAAIPAPPAGEFPKLQGVTRVEVKGKASEAVQVAWRLPGGSHADKDALTLAEKILSNRLEARVNNPQRVKGAGSGMIRMNEAGQWLVLAEAKDGQTPEEAEKILMDEVAAFKAGRFSDAELKSAIAQLDIERKKQLEKNIHKDDPDRISVMIESYIDGEQWADTVAGLARLRTLKKADVLRVANAYLGEDRVVVTRRKGQPALETVSKPAFTPVTIDPSRASSFYKELAAYESKPIEPRFLKAGRDYEKRRVPSGTILAAKNPVNDLFHVEFRFDRGQAHDKRLDLAMGLMEVSGAGTMSASALHRELEKMGSEIKVECSGAECAVRVTGLEANLEKTLRLALTRFNKPNVPRGAFKKLLAVERAKRAAVKENPQALFEALGGFASRGRDSDILKDLTPAELDAVTEAQLKKSLASVFDYKRTTLYAGSRSAADLAKLLGKLQTRKSFKKAPKTPPVRLLVPEKPRVVFVHRAGMAQALIGAYAADGPYDADSRLDQTVYNNAMGGGMGGIYFQEVRESRALAYTTGGGYKPGARAQDDAQVVAKAGTQADKAVQTATLLEELMARPPITPERYALSRRLTEETYRTAAPQLDQVPEQLLAWSRLGFTSDPREGSFAALASHTPEALARFTGRFAGKPLTLYVVGDKTRVDLEGLKKLGALEERSVDELFPY